MIKQKIFMMLLTAAFSFYAFAQPTHVITDIEKRYKEVKALITHEQYSLAYPLIKDLKTFYSGNFINNPGYIIDDIQYFEIVCGLKLKQEVSKNEAIEYLSSVNNTPRRQMLSYHLAHYFFLQNDHINTIKYYNEAGYDNMSNEQIAIGKFEKAYSYFSLEKFTEAKPLFNEIHQLPTHKHFVAANYYYGFISYFDKEYDEALSAFKVVEKVDDYKGVVPYYIAEIYYFQNKKAESLKYSESALAKGITPYYEKRLKLLLGQLYFENKNYKKALPLLEDYVNNTSKVSKEILYELSYSYYKEKTYDKAIEGFKQLSNEKDSMGQNSMYILGDLYLQTGDKANARNAFQYGAFNTSNVIQQKVSKFNYAKLSYELGYQDIALTELKNYISDYPRSEYDAEAKEILVSLLANTNNFSEALALYESFERPTATMQKVYPRILYGKAIEHINDQQLSKADELLVKILSMPSANNIYPYSNFWKGEIAYRQGRYDEAIRYLNVYLFSKVAGMGEANPAAAQYTTAYSFFQKENYKQALGYFEQVAKNIFASSSSMEQDAYIRSGDCYYMLKDFIKAGSIYDVVINNNLAQSDYALLQKANIAGIKNSAEKIKILNSLIIKYPNTALQQDVNMEIALTYIADEKFKDAVPFLDNIIKSNAEGLKPKAYLKQGLAYYNSNNNKEALDIYNLLILKYPQSPEADEAFGIVKDIYIEEGKPNEYLALMQKNGRSVSVPQADSLLYSAALSKYNSGDCVGTIKAFNNYLTQYPSGEFSIESNFMRSECYQKNKEFKKALEGYEFVNSKGLSKYFEKATLEAGRISYFELKDYSLAKKYFQSLSINAVKQENILEALRGLVRSHYQLKDFKEANNAAKNLLTKKGISTDDKSVSFLVLGKAQQLNDDCNSAIISFKSCAAINKTAWGAEARYEIAKCYLILNNVKAAEKAAMAVIKETGSYDFWVTSSYILLGDVFMQQKDYFNAKATYESVAKKSVIAELKKEAQDKFEKVVEEEKQNSKISN